MIGDLGPVVRAILMAVLWVGVWHLTRRAGARAVVRRWIIVGAVVSIVLVELGMQQRIPIPISMAAVLVSVALNWRPGWLIQATGGPRPEVGALLALFALFRDQDFEARRPVPAMISALGSQRASTTGRLIDVATELAADWIAGQEIRTVDPRLAVLWREIQIARQRSIEAGVDPRLVAYEAEAGSFGS